jgi:hypothetical protein
MTGNKNSWIHQLNAMERALNLLPLSDEEKNNSKETINTILCDINHYNHLRQVPIINARIAHLRRKLVPITNLVPFRFPTTEGITPPRGSGFSCQHYVRSKLEKPSHPSLPTTRPRLISS